MVKLIPRCFAANNETVYFLARTTQKTKYGTNELAVLAKSDPYPASIHDAKRTVVSTYNTCYFSGLGDIFGDSGALMCTVDNNGVFIFTGPYYYNARRSYRFDPQAPKNDYFETFPKNTTGEWAALVLNSSSRDIPWGYSSSPEPYYLFSVNGRNSTSRQ